MANGVVAENMSPPRRKYLLLALLGVVLGLAVISYIYFTKQPDYNYAPPSRLTPANTNTLSPIIKFTFQEPINTHWKEHSFKGNTSYRAEADVLHAKSEGTSSVIFKEYGVSPSQRPVLSWEWKAVQFPSNKANKKLGAKSDNDFAARIYVVFKGRIPMTSDIIQYVWDDHFNEGDQSQSAFAKNVKIYVTQHGKAEDWVLEERDLLEDYKKLYGKYPHGEIMGVGIMTDSDNTGTSAEAQYRNVQLLHPSSSGTPAGK